MKIGILSECQRQSQLPRRALWRRTRQFGVEQIDTEKNGFEVLAVQLPYTLQELRQISEKKRAAAMRRACEFLLSAGVRCAVFTRGMKEFYTPEDAEGLTIAAGGEVFEQVLPGLVRRLAEKYRVSRTRARLGICDRTMGRKSAALMRELCYDARYLQLYTDNLNAADALSRDFSEEYGLPVTVGLPSGQARCDILIDLDNRKLRVGRDLTIDGLEFDLDTGGYDVDTAEVANGAGIPLSAKRIKYCTCGKKKLTL